jgi:hypothetical protein
VLGNYECNPTVKIKLFLSVTDWAINGNQQQASLKALLGSSCMTIATTAKPLGVEKIPS